MDAATAQQRKYLKQQEIPDLELCEDYDEGERKCRHKTIIPPAAGGGML